MAGKNTRNEIWSYSIFGAVVLAGTVALMLFGLNSSVSADIGPLLAGLALSTCVFRFGPPWKWPNFLFLASFFIVGMLLGQPGLVWMGGYLAGAQFGVAWRLVVKKSRMKATWTVNGRGIDTLTDARKLAKQELDILDGERHHRLVVEHGPASFEVAGSLPSKLVCHRNHDADNDFSWAVLQSHEQAEDSSVEVPIGRIEGFMPSRYVSDIGTVDEALKEFLKNPNRGARPGLGYSKDCIRPAPKRMTPERESGMTVDVNELTLDTITFSGLLRFIRQPELAEDYAARAMYLRSNPRADAVGGTRAWAGVHSSDVRAGLLAGTCRTRRDATAGKCVKHRLVNAAAQSRNRFS